MSLEARLVTLMPYDQLSEGNNHENRGKVWNFLLAALAAYSFNGGHTAFDAVSSQTGGLGSQQQHRNSRRKLAGQHTAVITKHGWSLSS